MRRAPDQRRRGRGAGPRWAPLAIALAAFAPGCRRHEADLPWVDPSDLRIEVGLAGVIDSNRWTVIRVRARNRGADFRGAVELRGSSGVDDDPVVTTAPLEIAGQGRAVREVLIPVRPRGWTEVRVTLRQPGWAAAFRKDVILSDEAKARVLAVSRTGRDLRALESAIPPSPRDLRLIPPGDLVPEPLAYDAFQAIVLLGATLEDAPLGTVEALGRWVERGGTLIAFPGPEWASGVPPETLDLLGVDLGDPGAALPGDVAGAIGPAALTGYYRAIAPRPGTRATGGLSFKKGRGTGNVVTFSFGPGEGSFPDEQAAPGIHGTLKLALGKAIDRPGGASPFVSLEDDAVLGLHHMSGSSVPPRSAVALGIAVYLGLGFFVPWVIFSRLRRREWTYAAVLAAAGLASVGIYRFGLLSARESAEIEEMSILRLHQDGRAAEVSSFIGVISPRHERRDILPEDGSNGGESPWAVLPQLLGIGQSSQGAPAGRALGSETIEYRDGRLRLAPVTLYPNGMLCLRSDYLAAADASPRVSFQEADEDTGLPYRVKVTSQDVGLTVYRAARGNFELLGRAEPGKAFFGGLIRSPTQTPAQLPPHSWRGARSEPLDETANRIVNEIVPVLRRDSILLVSHEGVFPPGRRFAVRNGVTVTVIEIPNPGEQ